MNGVGGGGERERDLSDVSDGAYPMEGREARA